MQCSGIATVVLKRHSLEHLGASLCHCSDREASQPKDLFRCPYKAGDLSAWRRMFWRSKFRGQGSVPGSDVAACFV
uniref:Uncharacterized protein n=1 Tax=Anguilla anguilla TaxID=7936 RepID=A0A0E9W4B4_ANGAN